MEDPLLEYKGKLREALGLVPYMCQDKRMEAATFWNNLAQELQDILSGNQKSSNFNHQDLKFHGQQDTHSHQINCNQNIGQTIDHQNFLFRDISHEGHVHNNQVLNTNNIQAAPYSDANTSIINVPLKQNSLETHFPDQEIFDDKIIYNQVFSETPSVSPLIDCKDHVSDVFDGDDLNVAIKDNGLIFDPTQPLYTPLVQPNPKCPEKLSEDHSAANSGPSTMHSNIQYGLMKQNEMIAQVPDSQNCDNKLNLGQQTGSSLSDSYYPTSGIQTEGPVYGPYPTNHGQDQISTTTMNKPGLQSNIEQCNNYNNSMSQTSVQFFSKASSSAESSPGIMSSNNQNGDSSKLYEDNDAYAGYNSNVQHIMDSNGNMPANRNETFTQSDRPLQPIQLFISNPTNQNYFTSSYVAGNCRSKALFCAICNMELPTNEELEKHMSGHADEKIIPASGQYDYKTTGSESAVVAKESVIEEVALKIEGIPPNGVSPSSQHTCEVCGKSGFSTKGNLKRHLRAHSGEKPFKCDHCSSCFTEKKSLKIHVRRHTGEKPYKCDVCGKLFSQTGVLQSHMALHLNERKFECSKCSKAFRQRSQLKLHLMRHDGVKKLECSTCAAKFLTKGDLERHRRIHTGERPYSCELCNKTFTRQQSLNEHMNRHTGRKPYDCKYCDKTFSEMSACYKHAKTHKPQIVESQPMMLDTSPS